MKFRLLTSLNKSTLVHKKENLQNLEGYQVLNVIRIFWCPLSLSRKKVFRKRLSPIIVVLVQRLHNIIQDVGCLFSLKAYNFHNVKHAAIIDNQIQLMKYKLDLKLK